MLPNDVFVRNKRRVPDELRGKIRSGAEGES